MVQKLQTWWTKLLATRHTRWSQALGWCLLLIVSPLGLLVATEVISWQSGRITWAHLTAQPVMVLALAVLVALVLFWLLAVTGQSGVAVATLGTLLVVVSLISYFKMMFRAEPVVWADWHLLGETGDVVAGYNFYIPRQFYKSLLGVWLLALLNGWFSPRWRSWHWRLSWALSLPLLLWAALWSGTDWKKTWQQAVPDYNFNAQAPELSDEFGFLAYFVAHSLPTAIVAPADYNQATMARLLATAQTFTPPKSSLVCPPADSPAPDIIFVLNESFADLINYPGLNFATDPTPTFSYLQRTGRHGRILVNTRGGGTSETEFEIMTGLAHSLNPLNSTAFVQFIKRPLPALPAWLRAQGYQTAAIQPDHAWFLNADVAYPLLGIDTYLSLETFDHPRLLANQVADSEVTAKIKQWVGERDDRPQFIWVTTMENHGGYEPKKFPADYYHDLDYEYTPADGVPLTDGQRQALDNYIIGLRDADTMLQELIEFYQNSTRPAIIVFYGDHFPGFDAAMTDILSGRDQLLLDSAPFVIWDNFSSPSAQDYGTISAFQLSPLVLRDSCQPLSPLLQFLSQAYQAGVRGYNIHWYIDAAGQLQPLSDISGTPAQYRHQHQLWQYDWLHGAGYTFKNTDK